MASNENPYQHGSTTILQHEIQQYGDLVTTNALGDEAAGAIERRTMIQQQQWTCQMNHFAQGGDSSLASRYSLGAEPVRNLTDGKPLLDSQGRIITVERHLATKPLRCDLSTRPGPGNKKLTYISGDAVSRTLNEVFGFDGWSQVIKSITREQCIQDKEGRWNVTYTATVRIIIAKSGTYKEGVGVGSSKDKDMGQAIGNAYKTSITDAMKRAARYFGEKLGNTLSAGNFNIMNAPVTLEEALTRLETETEAKYRKKRALPPSEADQPNSGGHLLVEQTAAIDAPPEPKVDGSGTALALAIGSSGNIFNKSFVQHNSKVVLPSAKTNEAHHQPSCSVPSKIINPYQASTTVEKELTMTIHAQIKPSNDKVDEMGDAAKCFASHGTNGYVKRSEERASNKKSNISAVINTLDASASSLSNCSGLTSTPPNRQVLQVASSTSNTNRVLQTSATINSNGGPQHGESSSSSSATVYGTSNKQNIPNTSVIARYKQNQQHMATHQSANMADNNFVCADGRVENTFGSHLLADWKTDPPLPVDNNWFQCHLSAPAVLTDVTNHIRGVDENCSGEPKRTFPDQQGQGHLEQPKRKVVSNPYNPYVARSRTSL